LLMLVWHFELELGRLAANVPSSLGKQIESFMIQYGDLIYQNFSKP